jgi:hypothetical protein
MVIVGCHNQDEWRSEVYEGIYVGFDEVSFQKDDDFAFVFTRIFKFLRVWIVMLPVFVSLSYGYV